jgi:predicted glycosyltransferase involved in capsule biosynthesis
MDAIIFCDQENETQRLFRSVFSSGIDGTIEVCQTIESFLKKIRKIGNNQTINVIAVNGHSTLDSLLNDDILIEEINKIVVLMDHDQDTVSKAHRLRPRYITSSHRGLSDLTAVLEKMVQNKKSGSSQ